MPNKDVSVSYNDLITVRYFLQVLFSLTFCKFCTILLVVIGSNMQYTYNWLHIPTGMKGTRTIICVSFNDFADKINNWNQMGAGTWQYWATINIGKGA